MRKLFGLILGLAAALIIANLWPHSPREEGPPPAGSAASVENPVTRNPAADILLVNEWNPLPDDALPMELVTLFEYKNRNFGLAGSAIQLDKSVFEAADAMFAAAKRDGVDGFILTSGYRDREKQEALYSGNHNGMVARPGHSEHETGLAFDVTATGSEHGFDTTPQFAWLIQNCWDYGFILRYPEGREAVTGIPYEPWHYRYVGLPHSREIRDRGTLEEYLR